MTRFDTKIRLEVIFSNSVTLYYVILNTVAFFIFFDTPVSNFQHVLLHSLIPTPPHFLLGTNHKRRYNVLKSDFFCFCTTSNLYILQTTCLTFILKLSRCSTFLIASINVFNFTLQQPHEALYYFKLSCFRTYSTFLLLISHKPVVNFDIPNYQHVPLYLLNPTPPHLLLGINHKRRYKVSKSDFLGICTNSNLYIFQTKRFTIIVNLSRCNTFLTAFIDVFTFSFHQPHEVLCYFKVSCFRSKTFHFLIVPFHYVIHMLHIT